MQFSACCAPKWTYPKGMIDRKCVLVGQEETMSCDAFGDPDPNFAYYKNGQLLNTSWPPGKVRKSSKHNIIIIFYGARV